jgi:uncharacterized small protein (DUF1192 family)
VRTAKHALPEEIELERKKQELTERESELSERELELATLGAELFQFEIKYHTLIGKLYVEIDRLQAEIALKKARRYPSDSSVEKEAERLSEKARETRREYESVINEPIRVRDLSPELKALYRSLAKKFHPDLTLDPEEKIQRSSIMIKINQAYMRGDYDGLKQLAEELEISPEAIPGKDIASQLVKVIRKISQIDKRLQTIRAQIIAIKETPLTILWQQYKTAVGRGEDLFVKLAFELEVRISALKEDLSGLES